MLNSDVLGLIILALCVVFFIKKVIPSCIVALCGCVALVLTGACSFESAFSGFSSSIVVLMTCSMIVGIALFKTGCADIIGDFVVRVSKNNEKRFLIFSCIAASVMAMFLANTAVLASFITILDAITASSNRIKKQNILLPIACSVMFGGACTLVGCTPQLTANGMLKSLVGQEMGMFTLFGPGIVMLVVFILYAAFIGYPLGKRIWGEREIGELELDDDKVGVGPDYSMTIKKPVPDRKKLILMVCVLVFMILSYVIAYIPAVMTALISALLCIIFRLCTVKDVEKDLNWRSIIFLAACLGLAEGITQAGTGELMSNAVFSILGNVHNEYLIFAIIVFVTLFISQFITNSTAIIIVLPIALSFVNSYGYSAMAFCVGVTMAASMACCTPIAAAQITMTQVAGYEFSDYVRYSWPLTIIEYFVIILVVPLMFPLV